MDKIKIDLNMFGGSQTVLEINKPETMVPENIKKGVDIGGVIGTYDGSPEEPGWTPEPDKFTIKVIDYDGSIVKREYLETGSVFTLPNPPMHADLKLVFERWNSPVDIFDNTITVEDKDITIGIIYDTEDLRSRLKVSMSHASGLDLAIKFYKADAEDVCIYWGDGTSSLFTGEADKLCTYIKTYSGYGDYTIEIEGKWFLKSNNSTSALFMGTSVKSIFLTEAILSSNMTEIGNYGLFYMRALKYISLSSSTIVTGAHCFYNCFSLKSISLPSGSVIGVDAFYSCNALELVIIPSGVTKIDTQAFFNCYSLKEIYLPDSVTEIGSQAFSSCSSLVRCTVRGAESIGATAFLNCDSLVSITLPDTLTVIGERTFSGCSSLKYIAIPAGVSDIKSSVFQDCNSLERVMSKSEILTLHASAFNGCRCLKEIFATNGVTLINSAGFIFSGNYNLKKIKLANGTTHIPAASFSNCNILFEMDLTSLDSVPALANDNALPNVNLYAYAIYVKESLVSTFKTATYWVNYASRIFGVPDGEIV